jgi:hypothetical protein
MTVGECTSNWQEFLTASPDLAVLHYIKCVELSRRCASDDVSGTLFSPAFLTNPAVPERYLSERPLLKEFVGDFCDFLCEASGPAMVNISHGTITPRDS